ncbi:MAG TPA: enoyl-CoA hydratase-related protein [Caulobacteraceae bacterium]|jgi:2-(1,2-epoxy-1,2-dihydrophenyl)acetyl-CoA isomerase|nr:enoyl-CoA hydratase-related protein [Caulobacteraceae bacterium]
MTEPAADGACVRLEVANGLASVILDRPRNGNAIDLALARDLMTALHACERDRSVRVVELRGEGRLFCAGGDLAAIRANGEEAPAYVRSLLVHLHEAISAIARIPVPVVARVHGAAAGAGLALAASCDLVVAAQSSRFLMAYSRVGLTPDGSSTWFLPRLIGVRRALELALTNRELSAAEALDWGLVNEVVADERLDERMAGLMGELVAGPSDAVGETKRLLRASLSESLETQMVHEMQAITGALATPEAREGLAAFLEKRPPNFRL